MNLNEVTIKKFSKFQIPKTSKSIPQSENLLLMLQAEVMRLGFILSADTVDKIKTLDIVEIYNSLIPTLKKIKGADVDYVPFYVNFPNDVNEKSDLELLLNAICHYWSNGTWIPEQTKELRNFEIDFQEFQVLDCFEDEQEILNELTNSLLFSNDSISAEDKEILVYCLKNNSKFKLKPKAKIKNKEILSIYIGEKIKNEALGKNDLKLVKTPTDILRIITYLSAGDISLNENTKFKSLKRSQRKLFVSKLEEVINEDDIKMHKNKWIRVFHNLHIGEYKNEAPNTFKISSKIRNNKTLNSITSRIQKFFEDSDINSASNLLMKRPGIFARRLDELLRKSKSKKEQYEILKRFNSIISEISTRVLTQIYGHFKGRLESNDVRVSFPKGNTQKVFILKKSEELDKEISAEIIDLIENEFKSRFSKLKSLGKVWINPKLENCPLPTQQRSSSKSIKTVARGTRLPFGDLNGGKETLRFFVYWKGQDIDLSATFHNKDFKMVEQVSYTNLRSSSENGILAAHSGDITNAPNGASEFIDINIPAIRKYNSDIRYVVMNVYVYRGPSFLEHKICNVGWMLRSQPKSNEIYDARTVVDKFDLVGNSKNSIPLIFDLETLEVIWTDIYTTSSYINNTHTNREKIELTLKALTNLKNKTNLFDIFYLHGISRGTIVDEKEKANVIFDLNEGITPKNINKINSEFII